MAVSNGSISGSEQPATNILAPLHRRNPETDALCMFKGGLVVASNARPGLCRLKVLISSHREQDTILYVNSTGVSGNDVLPSARTATIPDCAVTRS